jgi:hypothetical protein
MIGPLRHVAPGQGALLLATGVLLIFYSWTASAGLPMGFGESLDGPYNLLTQALLRGQLHLAIEPRPELFEMVDPYEPSRNAPFRFHDASLYQGRYYLYFGVVPVLLAFAPWRVVGLGDLPEPAAAVAFGLGGFVFSALLLRRILRAHLGPPSPAVQLLAFIVLGLSNLVPFLLRSPHVYEVAIAAGLFFATGAAWLFAADGTPSLSRLAAGGLFLGLAVGCRPNLLLLAPVLPLLARAPAPPGGARGALRSALALFLPLGTCLVALGLYNRARFDSWTEFGTSYQLLGARRISGLDYRALPPMAYYHFLAPPTFTAEFPLVLPYQGWPFRGSVPEGFFLDPRATGALVHTPFLLILLGAPWVLRGATLREPALLRRRLVVLGASGLALPLLTSLAFSSVAMRFQADFLTFLIIPALFLWIALAARVAATRRAPLRVAAAAAFGWSLFAALALSVTGADDNLRKENPALYAAVERRFEPLRVALLRVLDPEGRTVVRLKAAFPEQLAAEAEPLLSWGTVDEYDVLWVSQPAPGVFAFSLDTTRSRGDKAVSRPVTPGVGIEPGRFHDLVLELDRVRKRVRGSIGGDAVFELRGRLVAVHPNRVWPGRGPRGHGAPIVGQFSGSLIPQAMIVAGPPGLASLPPIAPTPAVLAGARQDLPRAAPRGGLGIVAGRPGAWLFDGAAWRWIPRAFVERVRLQRPIAPAVGTAGDPVPILVSGDASGADAVVARRVGGGRVAFATARWNGAWSLGPSGPAVRPAADPAAALTVTLDRPARSVVVAMDGREVLRASVDLLPLACDRLLVGSSPDGMAFPRPPAPLRGPGSRDD